MARRTTLFGLLLAVSASGSVRADLLAVDGFESGDLSFRNAEFVWADSNGDPGAVPQVTSEVAHSGQHSLKFTFKGGAAGSMAWSEQRFDMTRSLTELYIQWYQLFPSGTEGLGTKWRARKQSGPNNNKMLRLWADEYSNFTVKAGLSSWPSSDGDARIYGAFGKDGALPDLLDADSVPLDDKLRGRWVKFQVHVRVDDGGGNGLVELWVDDKKLMSDTVAGYPQGGIGNYFRHGYFMGWANSGFDDTSYTYVDDVVVSTAFIGSVPPAAPEWISATPQK